MANSRYEYVKTFEGDGLMPHTWIVIRLDGRSFTRFSKVHNFEKPNDERALLLMNECAKAVLEDISDAVFGYGMSDEFRCYQMNQVVSTNQRWQPFDSEVSCCMRMVLPKYVNCMFGSSLGRYLEAEDPFWENMKRATIQAVLVTLVDVNVILFFISPSAVGGGNLGAETLSNNFDVPPAVLYCGKPAVYISDVPATYVMKWAQFFPGKELQYAPSFDGRAVCYPSDEDLRDYLAWRQVDCHVNNQYNTCYWNLVKSGSSGAEAQALIKGTLADFKNELLHSRFQINYNELPAIFRKGSLVFKRKEETVVKYENGVAIKRARVNMVVVHEDLIKDTFWNENPYILSARNLKHIDSRSTTLKEQDSESSIRDDGVDND